MIVLLLTPILLWVTSKVFLQLGWKTTNFEGNATPYSLGICIFIIVIYFFSFTIETVALLYLAVLWLTGFIDDRYGSKYPKGIRGHINFFIKTGKVSTGLMKIIGTVITAFLFAASISSILFWQFLLIFVLLVLTPHVMNLFDTRPLRVWKVVLFHGLLFFSLSIQMIIQFSGILFVVAVFMFFEAKRVGMLGDNGATLLGGMLSLLVVYSLPIYTQSIIVGVYVMIVIVAEKISISRWIETRPILNWFDRLGVS